MKHDFKTQQNISLHTKFDFTRTYLQIQISTHHVVNRQGVHKESIDISKMVISPAVLELLSAFENDNFVLVNMSFGSSICQEFLVDGQDCLE